VIEKQYKLIQVHIIFTILR